MVDCEQVQPNLLDYARKQLTALEQKKIKAHIDKCADCAAVLKEELDTFEALAAIPEHKPSADVWVLVRSRTKPSRLRPLVLLHALIATNARKAATATIAALLAIGYYNAAVITPGVNQAQKTQAVVTVYSDDPLGGHTDAVVASIDDM